ncbi:cobalt ABC transporter [Thioclava dalianensis]|uniref:Cobalt ABC transporter n=1 Tax=Thioclava dalianensis TaxID=1185766 RepID=A0A074TZJ8_9RHOB|nr:energy-coupling factor ABC transporter ATP-binding protein [Thioclava dalianensis]KEP67842.1 cobalt ABC transporter [Thioclava dalianensis]SFN94275.1 biotin transport system ATP-binding protein [Thioclava dalianensis]
MSLSDAVSQSRSTEAAPQRIELVDVGLSLEDRVVFDGLSLSGEVRDLGLIGRNGAGKSQFLRLIAGLVTPDTGQVRVNGFDPARDRRRATSEIGFVFQNPDHALLFPTVIEEIGFGPQSRGLSKSEAAAVAENLLQRFGVAAWRDRLVHALSQGQKHLLGLIAACANDPALLLLDEAFAGLDLATSRSLRRTLDALPTARIEASHDLIAMAARPRLLWIDAGRIRMDGPPEQVLPVYRQEMEAQVIAPDSL